MSNVVNHLTRVRERKENNVHASFDARWFTELCWITDEINAVLSELSARTDSRCPSW